MKVPEGWEVDRLGGIAELQRGFDLPASKRIPGSIPIISSGGETGSHNEAKVKAPGVVTGRYGSIGHVFYVEKEFWPLNTALWVKDFHGNDPKFIYYVLSNFDFKKFSDKTGVPGVNRNDLHTVKILLPLLLEQRKIAKILGTWDKAIATTEKLITTSKQQKKSLMQQLLNGKVRLCSPTGEPFSGSWDEVRLGELSTKVGSGVTPKGGSATYKDFGTPLIRSQNVLWGKLDLSDVVYIDDMQHGKMKSSTVRLHDVLLNITGASIGRVSLSNLDEANVNQHVCIIRCEQRLVPSYLKYFLLSFEGQKQIEQCQAGGNRQGLNFNQIKSFKVLVPSFVEQQKIVQVLIAADKEVEILEAKLAHLQQEKKALMQQLLTGKRRVKIDEASNMEAAC